MGQVAAYSIHSYLSCVISFESRCAALCTPRLRGGRGKKNPESLRTSMPGVVNLSWTRTVDETLHLDPEDNRLCVFKPESAGLGFSHLQP